MAVTLDTLELDIQSDAEGASSGIRDLIDSLKTLIPPVVNGIGALKELDSVLKSIKRDSAGIRFDKMFNATGMSGAARKVKRDLDSVAQSAVDARASMGQRLVGLPSGAKSGEVVTPNRMALGSGYAPFEPFIEGEGYVSGDFLGLPSASEIRDEVSEFEDTVNDAFSGIHIRTNHRPNGFHYGTSPMDPEWLEKINKNVEENKKWKDAVHNSRVKPTDEGFKQVLSELESNGKTKETVEDAYKAALERLNVNSTGEKTDFHYGTSPMDQEWLDKINQQAEKNREWADAIRSKNSQVNEEFSRAIAEMESGSNSGVKNLGKDAKETTSAFAGLKKQISGIFKGSLLQQFGRVLRMRAIRAVIMGLARGFKEGIGNLREWSDGVNGHFSAAMNSAQDHLTLMKNSVATALAPAIEAAIPIFNVLTGAINAASNALAQFFALLTGKSSWTKATLAVGDYTKATKGAGGASKDLLADWDELNVIQSSGGGGGGGSGASVTDMFEEQYAFAEPIRDIVSFLKDNFEDIMHVAIGIGTAIKAWGLSKKFEGTLGKILGGITGLLVMGVTWKITDDSDEHFLGGDGAGWLVTNVLTNALGATLAGTIAQNVIGGKAGVITAGITLAVSGGIDIVNAFKSTSEHGLGLEEFATSLLGSAKEGVMAALLAVGFGMGTGAAVTAGLLTFGITAAVSLGIAAAIHFSKKDLDWGDVELSEEQVKQFVESKMFTVDVNAVVDKINASLADGEEARKTIENLLLGINTEYNLIKIGLDEKTTYGNLQKYFTGDGGLISQVQSLIESNQDRLKLALTLTPFTGENGKETEKGLLADNKSGWDEVSDWYSQKGSKLGELLQKGIKGAITKGEKETAQALIEEINHVTSIVTQAKMEGSALGEFVSGLNDINLSDMTKDTFEQVLSVYNDYEDKLHSGYTEIWNQAIADQNALVAFLFDQDPNSPEYAKAVADLQTMMDNYEDAILSKMETATKPAKEKIQKWIADLIGTEGLTPAFLDFTHLLGTTELKTRFADQMTSNLGELIKRQIESYGISLDMLDVFDISGADLLSQEIVNDIQKFLAQSFDQETVRNIMRDLGFGDVSIFTAEKKNNPVKELTQQEQMEEDWHTYYQRNRKELLNRDGTPAMTVTTPAFAPMSDDTGSAITGKLDTLNGNIQQVVSAINAVNGTVQNKDTKPVVNVNIPGGSPAARMMGAAKTSYDRVNGVE